MKVEFHTCDVFTRTRFAGNPLAVVPDARGLTAEQMQQIAREFNYSETTFVLPPEQGYTRRVRIFTPAREVPFAGHPNIGTAFILAHTGALGELAAESAVVFEEEAGTVPVRIRTDADAGIWCELTAPQGLTLGPEVAVEAAAAALSLPVSDILTTTHAPRVAGVGLPFLVVEVCDLPALRKSEFSLGPIQDLERQGIPPDILLYARTRSRGEMRARMFAPLDGVPEDPATGSANCALAALLTHHLPEPDGVFEWRITQGVEMGRPSLLQATTVKTGGRVSETRIGGHSVAVSRGTMDIG